MYAIGLLASFCINVGCLLIYRFFMGTKEIRGGYVTSRAGTLALEAILVACFPAATLPAPLRVHYYTPLWTEESPERARLVFLALALVGTAALALPRTLFSDPIAAHRGGESSLVSGRKRFRWLVTSALVSLAIASVVVYWAMARYMP